MSRNGILNRGLSLLSGFVGGDLFFKSSVPLDVRVVADAASTIPDEALVDTLE